MVPGVPSRWIGLTTPSTGILPGHQGRTPPRPARCSRLRGRLTRATADSHRDARPARAASGASTLHQPLRPLRAGLPLGPSPHDAAPTPSLSQWRSELRRPDRGREELASFVGARIARNVGNQRLATLREPPEPILSRVRCIAWFWATSADSSGRGTASHSQQNRRKGDASYRTDRSDGDNDHVDVRIQPRAWARKTKEHHSENGDHCPHSAHEQVEQSLAWTP